MTAAAVYLVTGDDPALVGAEVHRLIEDLVGDADPALCVEQLDDDEYTAGQVVESLRTPSFFAARRVVVAHGIGRFAKADLAPILDYLEAPEADAVAVLVHDRGGKLAPGFSASVKKAGEVLVTGISGVGKKARDAWWATRLKSAGVKLAPSAVARLDAHLGEDVGRADGILAALADAYGPGAAIDEASLEPFLGSAGAVKPWDLTDALDRGDIPGSLAVLARMTDAGGMHPLQIMGLLQNHYGRALRLDGSGASGEKVAADLLGMSGRSTFPAKKALDLARRLGSSGVGEAISLLAQADLDLRGNRSYGETKDTERLVMEILVARLARLTRRQRRPA